MSKVEEVSTASAEANAAFQSIIPIISKEFEAMADGKPMLDKLIQRLNNTFQNPPQQDFEFFVSKRVSLDEVRVAMFQPLQEQVSYFTKGLLAGLHAPKDHSLKKTSSVLLTLLYLVHRKNLEFVKEFILNDGFEALIEYLDADNLYERSQAMETMMSLTDCDFFDWFAPAKTYEQQQLHLKLISILTSLPADGNKNQNYFIEKLLKNRLNSYPGGSLRALQLLAFWLSWVRALYTKDHRLVLSKKLLEEIRQWARLDGTLKKEGEELDEDEAKLAETLYEDFGKKQFEDLNATEKESIISTSNDGLTVSGIQKPEFKEGLPAIGSLDISAAVESKSNDGGGGGVTSPTFEVTPTIEVAVKYKSEGNEHYKAEKYDLALKSYQYAMNTVQSILRGNQKLTNSAAKEGEDIISLKITLHTNIANTLWKLWTDGEEENEEVDQVPTENISIAENPQYFEDIKFHCEAVLELSPNHVKAMYRLANAYIKKQELKTAYAMITAFMQQLNSSVSSSTSSSEDAKLFDRLKRKCIALQLYQLSSTSSSDAGGSNEAQSFNFEEWNFTVYDIIYLKSLLKRLQVSESIITKLMIPAEKLQGRNERQKTSGRRKAEQGKDDGKAEDDQSFMTNQDLLQEIPKQQEMIPNKAPKSQLKIVKMKASDRKLINQLRATAKTMKASFDERKTVSEELESPLRSGFELIKELWDHELKLKDIYGSLIDESDLLYLFTLLALVITPPANQALVGGSVALSYKPWIGGSEVLKVLEQLLKCERLQSIVFLMKYDYQDLFTQLVQLIGQLLKEESIKTVKGNQKLLQQFLTLLSS